jgi:hypothetical protein
MSTTAPKNKKRSGNGNRQPQKSSNGSSEPSDQEMVLFHGLLRGKNEAAMAAHNEFSTSKNKSKFYLDIVSLCRQSSNLPNTNTSSSSSASSSTSGNQPTANAGDNQSDKQERVATPSVVATGNATSKTQPNAPEKTKKQPRKVSKAAAATATPVTTTVPPPTSVPTPVPTPAAPVSSVVSSPVSTPAPIPVVKDKPLCNFFVTQGSCRKGKKCRFVHPDGELEGDGRCWIWVAPPGTTTGTDTGGGTVEGGITGRGEIPRNNSVDNAMGLMDMDMQYLEENLDMRLEDKSRSPTSEQQQDEDEEPGGTSLYSSLKVV